MPSLTGQRVLVPDPSQLGREVEALVVGEWPQLDDGLRTTGARRRRERFYQVELPDGKRRVYALAVLRIQRSVA